MIFYFSGTGNSLHAAKRIGELIKDDKLVSIAEYTKMTTTKTKPHNFTLEKDEKVGIVFPVYAWGPPKPVLDFIDNLVLDINEGNYIYSVATCGKNVGNTMKLLKKHLVNNGLKLDSGFSVVMPNNYILAGDVDSKQVQTNILAESEKSFQDFSSRIRNREQDVFIVEKGALPFILTGVIHPAFVNAPYRSKPFYATDNCNKCGICVKVCNCGNIELKEKPIWGNNCTQCLACIHYCPKVAIQYGKATINKGRYTNPYVKRNYE